MDNNRGFTIVLIAGIVLVAFVVSVLVNVAPDLMSHILAVKHN
jgi:hypothetical protein